MGEDMKKIYLLIIICLMLVGCTMGNSPTSRVEDLFTKYQKLDEDISMGIDNVVNQQDLTKDHKERYRKLLERQYKNLFPTDIIS